MADAENASSPGAPAPVQRATSPAAALLSSAGAAVREAGQKWKGMGQNDPAYRQVLALTGQPAVDVCLRCKYDREICPQFKTCVFDGRRRATVSTVRLRGGMQEANGDAADAADALTQSSDSGRTEEYDNPQMTHVEDEGGLEGEGEEGGGGADGGSDMQMSAEGEGSRTVAKCVECDRLVSCAAMLAWHGGVGCRACYPADCLQCGRRMFVPTMPLFVWRRGVGFVWNRGMCWGRCPACPCGRCPACRGAM